MKTQRITSQKTIREEFWATHTEFSSQYNKTKRIKDYSEDIQSAWIMYIDSLEQQGFITEKLANRVTL